MRRVVLHHHITSQQVAGKQGVVADWWHGYADCKIYLAGWLAVLL